MSENPLPPGWHWTSLGEIAAVQGGLAKGKKRGPKDAVRLVPYLRVANVQRGHLDLGELRLIEATEEEIAKLRLLPGDILLNEGGDRDKLGRGWVWSDEVEECIHQNHVFRARLISSALDPRFVSHYGNSEGQKFFLNSGKQTTGLASISKAKLESLPVPLPPANEQRRIVAKFETITGHSRTARAALDQVPPLLERFRQSVLAAAFRGDLTAEWRRQHPNVEPSSVLLERIRAERRRHWEEAELALMRAKGRTPANDRWKAAYEMPEIDPDLAYAYGDVSAIGWSVAPLEGLADAERGIPYGIVKTGGPCPHGVPTVRCGDIKGFSINVADLKRVHPDLDAQYERTRLRGGEVLLAIRGSVGECAVAGPDMAGMNISREVAMIPVLDGVLARYVMYLLASPVGQQCVAIHVKGVAQAGINLADLRRLPVPLPPRAEQVEVVRRIDTLLCAAGTVRRQVDEAHSRLDGIDQAILAKAFRGELVPQDSSDEPASVLLDRIRAERGSGQGTSKVIRSRRVAAKFKGRGSAQPDDSPSRPPTRLAQHSPKKPCARSRVLEVVLASMKRDALHRVADACLVELADRRSLEAAREGLLQADIGLKGLLAQLDRDELKAVCRALDLEDRGKTKAELRDRILSARGTAGA